MQLIDDKYEILGKLGTGGQGNVYKARHMHLNEYYAVKLIADEIGDVPELVTRFRSEAQTMAKFRHENIVRVHNLITQGGRPYCLVLDFVDGPNLAEYLKGRGPLPPQDALEIARQLASALEHAHGFRVWHRDVKPRNVLIGSVQPWRVLLTDFGIAKIEDSDEHTRSGHMVATTRYAAPEQLGYTRQSGDQRTRLWVDQRTDVFGLGLVLFEMLEGRQFFQEMDLGEIVGWAWDPDKPPVRLTRSVHPKVEELVAQALARDPDERWQTMSAMLHEIGRCQRLVGRPAEQVPTADDSGELSDDNLDAEIRRLERERLRRQAQQARAQLEAACGRAATAGVPPAAPDAVQRAERLQAEGQDALERSLYDQARERFEAAIATLDRASEDVRRRAEAVPRERVLVAREGATAAQKGAERAGAYAHAADAMGAADKLMASADGYLAARLYEDAERDLHEARRAYETAAVAVRVRQVANDMSGTMTRAVTYDSSARDAPALGARSGTPTDRAQRTPVRSPLVYAVVGAIATLLVVGVVSWLGGRPPIAPSPEHPQAPRADTIPDAPPQTTVVSPPVVPEPVVPTTIAPEPAVTTATVAPIAPVQPVTEGKPVEDEAADAPKASDDVRPPRRVSDDDAPKPNRSAGKSARRSSVTRPLAPTPPATSPPAPTPPAHGGWELRK